MKKLVFALGLAAITAAPAFSQGLVAQWGFVVTVTSPGSSGKHVRFTQQVVTQFQGTNFASQSDCENGRQTVADFGIQTSNACMEFYFPTL